MSRRVPRELIGVGDVLLLSRQHAAHATRYALPAARTRVTTALESTVAHPRDQRWYRLDVPPDALQRLLVELDTESVPYEVWR